MKRWSLRNRKSYLVKIFTYFMMVLVIPVVVIIILNFQSLSIIKEQILLSNENTLKQVFQLIDTVAAEMRETCITVSKLEEVQNYITVTNDQENMLPYKRYIISKILNTYSKEKFEDVFVYYPQDDYIVSGVHGALTADNYYESYYGKGDDFKEEFFGNLECDSGYPMFYVMNSEGITPYLCVSMKYTAGTNLRNCVVSVVLDENYLKELIYNNHSGRGGCILMFDRYKELILAGDEKDVPYDMNDYTGDGAPYETRFDHESYVMQIYRSNEMKGYYAFAVPSEFFWKQLSGMRTFSCISILACICLGIVLVFGTSKRAYAPLGKIVDNLKGKESDANYDTRNIIEFEFLKELFYDEREEKQKLYREIKEAKVGMKERFIFRLLEGNDFGEGNYEDMFEMFEKNGIILCSAFFVSGILQIDSGNEQKDDLISFIISNVFEEIFNRADRGYVLYLAEEKYTFLLNLSNVEDGERIVTMLEEGKNFLEDNYALEMTIGYSKIHEGMRGIKEAYDEAQTALRYRYILGKGVIISYCDIEGREFSYLDSGQVMLIAMLEDYLNKTIQKDPVSKFVSEILRIYKIDEGVSLESLECFKFDVINAINRIGTKYGYSIEERQRNVKQLLEKEFLVEFEEQLTYLLVLFQQKKMEMENSNGVCQMARQYIEENFSDSQLSLSLVGRAVDMSASHLSKLYKDKYGVSLAYDITCIRLRNAKQLLQNTDLNINQIAERTGFSNGNVFIKVFKKWEGITPGRYKELM